MTVAYAFVSASSEVERWVEQLNERCKTLGKPGFDQIGWEKFTQTTLDDIIANEPKTERGGIRFNRCEFVEVPFHLVPSLRDLPTGTCEWNWYKFYRCDLSAWQLNVAEFRGSDFVDCSGPKNAHNADFTGASFSNCDLAGASFLNAKLISATLTECNLRGADLRSTDLTNAVFHGVEFDATTTLQTLKSTKNWQVDSYTIACVSSRSELTVGNKMDMVIRDDVAELRKQFSGLAGLLHLTSLAIFLAPYLWFVVSHWVEASFAIPTESSISLFTALARYFINAGVDWRSGFHPNWLPLSISILILLYNAVRFRLLWKTYELEATSRISGVPVRFSLLERVQPPKWLNRFGEHPDWNWLYQINKRGFWLYLLFVLYKTGHFLTMRIPIAE